MRKLICLLFLFLLLTANARSQQQSRIYTIRFATNKSLLSEENRSLLSLAIDSLKLKSNFKIYINGHADSDADSSYNMQLSLKRSLAVREFLIQNEIEESLITTRAMGEEQPLVENTTPFTKARNRRVEVIVLFEDPPAELPAEPDLPDDTAAIEKAGCDGDTLVELNDGYKLELSKCDWETNKECLIIRKILRYNYTYKESWLKKHIGFKNYKKYIKRDPYYQFVIEACYDSCFSKPVKLFVPQHQAADLNIKQKYSQKKNNKGSKASLSFKKEKRGELAYYTTQVYCPGMFDCGYDDRCGHDVSLKAKDNISILEYSYYIRSRSSYFDSLITAKPAEDDLLTDSYQHTFFQPIVLSHGSDTIVLKNLPIDAFRHGSKKIKTKGSKFDKKYILFIPFTRKYKCGHYKKYKIREKDLEYLKELELF